MDVSVSSNDVSRSSLQLQSAFFNLARETRDEIYEYAFSDKSISFNFRSLNIGASVSNAKDVITTLGLPPWLLTCHAICSEATETFFRTRYFSPRYRRSKPSMTPNSLLLQNESVRNIKFDCPYSPYWLEADWIDPVHEAPFRMFLQAIEPFLAPDLSLVIEWATYGQDWSVARELATYENWPKRLQGRFLRVEIDVLVRRNEDDDQYVKRMRNAEEFAGRLVGVDEADIRTSWGEKKELGLVSQKPCARCGYVHGEQYNREVRRLVTLRRS